MKLFRSVAVVAAVLMSVLVTGAPATAGDNPMLVSVNQSGTAAGDWVYSISISSTGRYVTFDSEGVDLVPGASTQMRRVYLRDALLGQTELCSVNSAGQAISKPASYPAMTADARFVRFGAQASPELQPGGTYLRDRALLTTTLVPLSNYKTQLSDDGQWIAAASDQAYLKHVNSGVVEVLSVSDDGEPANEQVLIDSYQCLSADMRFALFETQASNLVDTPTGGQRQVYVRDRLLGTTRLVSTTPAGVAADGSCVGASLSADGRFVAFVSHAKNLAALDPDADPQVYVKDLLSGDVELVSVNNAGEPSSSTPGPAPALTTSVSGDGRFVAFAIATSNLFPGIAGATLSVCVRDRLAGLTYAVSVDPQGHYGQGVEPMISRNGRAIAFISTTPCVPQDTNGNASDAYVYDRLPWTEIEPGLAGGAGVPRLVMQGAPAAQAPLMLAVTRTLPFSLAQLVVGFGQANLPFKGGTLVPVPAVLLALPTNAQGLIVLKAHWPAGVPAGTPLALQAWIPDAAGPFGFAATNGVANVAQ